VGGLPNFRLHRAEVTKGRYFSFMPWWLTQAARRGSGLGRPTWPPAWGDGVRILLQDVSAHPGDAADRAMPRLRRRLEGNCLPDPYVLIVGPEAETRQRLADILPRPLTRWVGAA